MKRPILGRWADLVPAPSAEAEIALARTVEILEDLPPEISAISIGVSMAGPVTATVWNTYGAARADLLAGMRLVARERRGRWTPGPVMADRQVVEQFGRLLISAGYRSWLARLSGIDSDKLTPAERERLAGQEIHDVAERLLPGLRQAVAGPEMMPLKPRARSYTRLRC